jgi:TRAP-type mannitol/chloroaromatic compound transport system substrate-binding protein
MDRRSFFKQAGLGVTAGLSGALVSKSVAAQAPQTSANNLPEITWRLASSFPRSLDTIFSAADSVSKKVAVATGGKFQIQVFAAGEIIPAFGVLDAVRDEMVEMAHTASYYFFGKNPVYAFDAAVPFGLNNRQMDAWYRMGNGLTLMRNFFAQSNIYNIPCGNTGTQMGGWFRKEIKSVEDFKGLKMRIGGFAGKVLAKLGALPQQIPGGEVYRSLEQGVIDAAEWIGPYDDQKLGFQKIAKNYYYPGWWEGSTNFSMYINKDRWQSLPAEYQAILTAACGDTHVEVLAAYDAKNPLALKQLVDVGVQLKPFPNEVLEACFQAAVEVYEETCSKNPTFKNIFDDFSRFRQEQLAWFKVNEAAFSSFSQQREVFKK